MLRLMIRMVSIGGGGAWAGSRAESTATTTAAVPIARQPARDRAAVLLLDQVNALVQQIGRVTGRIVPLREVQRRIDPARDLPQAAGR